MTTLTIIIIILIGILTPFVLYAEIKIALWIIREIAKIIKEEVIDKLKE